MLFNDTKPTSLVTAPVGSDPTLYRFLEDSGAVAAPTAAGATNREGLGKYKAIDVVATCAVDSYKIGVWWWYVQAGVWVFDTSIGYVDVNAGNSPIAFPVLNLTASVCATEIALEIKDVVGAALANVWLIGRQ